MTCGVACDFIYEHYYAHLDDDALIEMIARQSELLQQNQGKEMTFRFQVPGEEGFVEFTDVIPNDTSLN